MKMRGAEPFSGNGFQASSGHAGRDGGCRHKGTFVCKAPGEGEWEGREECTGKFFLSPDRLTQLSRAKAGTSLKRPGPTAGDRGLELID